MHQALVYALIFSHAIQTEEQTLLYTIMLESLLFIVYVPIRVYGHIFQLYAILFPLCAFGIFIMLL